MAKTYVRKVPPSRTKYEQNNPVVSFRVHKDIFDRVQHTKSVGDNSFADIFMVGLGKMEVGAKKLEEARKKGWDTGYKKGFDEATLKYKVAYHCSKCGQIMEVQYPNEKEAIDELMRKAGWAHQQCPTRR